MMHMHTIHTFASYKGKKSSLITYLSLIKAKWWGMLSDSHVKLFILWFTTSSIYQIRYPLQLLGFWVFTKQQNCKFLGHGNKEEYNSVHFYLTIYHVPFKFIRYISGYSLTYFNFLLHFSTTEEVFVTFSCISESVACSLVFIIHACCLLDTLCKSWAQLGDTPE